MSNLAKFILPAVGVLALVVALVVSSKLLHCLLRLSAPNIRFVLACAWGLAGIAAVSWFSSYGIGAWALSLEGPLVGVSKVGILVLLFCAGLAATRRNAGKLSQFGAWIQLATAAVGFVAGLFVVAYSGYGWQRVAFIAAVAVAPSLVIFAANEEEALTSGKAAFACARRFHQTLTAFVLGFLFALAILGMNAGPLDGQRAEPRQLLLLAKTVVFFPLAWLLGSRYAKRIAENTQKELTTRLLVGFVLMLSLIYVYASQFLGQFVALVWVYLSGLLFGRTGFRKALSPGLNRLVFVICLPILFFSAALKSDFHGWEAGLLLVIVEAIAARVLGAVLGARIAHLPWRESYSSSIFSLPQLEMGVILAGYGLERGLIRPSEFSVLFLAALGTTLLGVGLDVVLRHGQTSAVSPRAEMGAGSNIAEGGA